MRRWLPSRLPWMVTAAPPPLLMVARRWQSSVPAKDKGKAQSKPEGRALRSLIADAVTGKNYDILRSFVGHLWPRDSLELRGGALAAIAAILTPSFPVRTAVAVTMLVFAKVGTVCVRTLCFPRFQPNAFSRAGSVPVQDGHRRAERGDA